MHNREHHGREYLVAAVSIAGEFTGVRYDIAWLAWLAALFLWLAFLSYSSAWYPKAGWKKQGSRLMAFLMIAAATYYLSSAPKEYRDMSNEQIKEAEKQLANNLRQADADYLRKTLALRPGSGAIRETTIQLHQDFVDHFEKTYLSMASAMRCDLLRREDQPCPPVTSSNLLDIDLRLAPLIGELAGPNPLSELANYLDELANHLQ